MTTNIVPPTSEVDQPPPSGDISHQVKFILYTAQFLDQELQRYYVMTNQVPKIEVGAVTRMVEAKMTP